MGLSLLPFLCELCFKCLAWRHQTRKSLRCCLRIAYALLTRARVLLTQVIVPYADLTRTIFSTSPHHSFDLRAATFTCKNRSSDWQNQAVDDEDVEEDDEEVPPCRSSPSTKLTTFFDSTLAESTGITGEFLFQGPFWQRHAGTLVCLLAPMHEARTWKVCYTD